MPPEVLFEPAANGQRFYLYYPAQGSVLRGLVLYIHPFAEEMNKSRRMASLQARALAQAGYAVLQIDFLGCGDSSGDLQDASWACWVNDVIQGCHWLRRRTHTSGAGPDPVPLWLWGLRAGCLLAVAAADQLNESCHFVFWQAPASGKPLLQQFLRLKVAGEMVNGQAKGVMDGLYQQLAHGNSLEIAGYTLTQALANAIAQAVLAPPATKGQGPRLEWFELSTQDDVLMGPASYNTIIEWQQAGFYVRSHRVRGPAFWKTTEIEEAPALIEATVAALTNAVQLKQPKARRA